jgi:hypothetical protein
MSEIGGVNDVDHGDDIPATSIPVQRDEHREEPAHQHESEDAEDRREHGVALED